MAQLAEHVIGNDEVPGPNPGSSSKKSATSRLLIFYPSRRHGGLVCNHAAGVYVINAPRALYVITRKRVCNHGSAVYVISRLRLYVSLRRLDYIHPFGMITCTCLRKWLHTLACASDSIQYFVLITYSASR